MQDLLQRARISFLIYGFNIYGKRMEAIGWLAKRQTSRIPALCG